MKKLNAIIVLSLLALAIPAFAENPDNRKEFTFDQKKDFIIARIDKRIAMLQELKQCVWSSRDRDGLGKCRERFREEKEMLREDRREHRR